MSIAERSESTSEPAESSSKVRTKDFRRVMPVLVPVLALLAAALISIAAYQVVHAGRVFRGVSLAGVDLSHGDRLVSQQRVEEVVRRWEQQELVLRSGDRRWRMKPADLGLSAPASSIAGQAFSVGREGSIPERLRDQLAGLFGGYELRPILTLNQEQLAAAITPVCQEIDSPPLDAEIRVQPDGSLEAVESASGSRVDRNQLAAVLVEGVGFAGDGQVELPVVTVAPDLTLDDFQTAREQAERILQSPLKLRYGEGSWILDRQMLAGMVRITEERTEDEEVSTAATLDEVSLKGFLERIAADTETPPSNARLEIHGTSVEVIPHTEGQRVDVAKSLPGILEQALTDNREYDLVTESFAPPITTESLQPVRQTVASWLAHTISLRDGDRQWNLTPEQIAGMERFDEVDGPNGLELMPGLDSDMLAGYVSQINEEIRQPAKDARFRWKNGAVTVLEESQPGREIDIPSTVAALETAVMSGQGEVQAVPRVVEPAVLTSDQDKVVIREKLMEATTYYKGSSAARAHNVELAASRLDGALVPPGGVFSFDKEVGPTTLAAGFRMGYAISTANGQMETVPAEAGGICQVSTTLFHSVFWTGLEVVERHQHAYWITTYGQPPRGMRGLDAAVFTPVVDFKFRNNTDEWVAVKASAGGGVLTFSIHGTNPGWEVKVDGPKITNVRPADPTPVNQVDPKLPAGASHRIEYAQDGFDSLIVRTVVRDGEVMSTYEVSSSFKPSRNVFLVGPPAPAPQATATPEATPEPGAQPETTAEPSPQPEQPAEPPPDEQPPAEQQPTPEPTPQP